MVEKQEQLQIFNPHTSIPEWDYLPLLWVLTEEQLHQWAEKEEKRWKSWLISEASSNLMEKLRLYA